MSFIFFTFRLLHSDRDPIPDVPAVYFVMPTEENIDRMCQVMYVLILSDAWIPNQTFSQSILDMQCKESKLPLPVCRYDFWDYLWILNSSNDLNFLVTRNSVLAKTELYKTESLIMLALKIRDFIFSDNRKAESRRSMLVQEHEVSLILNFRLFVFIVLLLHSRKVAATGVDSTSVFIGRRNNKWTRPALTIYCDQEC